MGKILILRTAAALLGATALYGQGGFGYGGPAVSSRGLRNAGHRGSEPVNLRPYANVLGIADSGLLPLSRDSNGKIVNPGTLYGVEANIGAYGSKSWKRGRYGVDYQGNYRHYDKNTFFNGSDHFLGMDFSQEIGRSQAFQLRGVAGTSTRPIGGVLSLTSFDPGFLGIPVNEIFDNRSYFAEGVGQYIREFGVRNSVSIGASGFGVRRQSRALVGLNGWRTQADFNRRLSRRTTMGAMYMFFHVDYPRAFGEADVHTVMLQFGRQFGRSWELSMAGGASVSDFAGIRSIQLDPLVAELLGVSTGREAFNSINTIPAVQAQLTRIWRKSNLILNYTRGANPGNGLLLLNRLENGTVSYSYNSGERWAASGMFGYFSSSGLGNVAGNFRSFNAGSSFNYRLYKTLFGTALFDVRKLTSAGSEFNRTGSRIALGVTWSPGDIPVTFR